MKRRFYAVTSDNSRVYSFSSQAKRTEFLNDNRPLRLAMPTQVEAVPASAAIVKCAPIVFKG
jgi:hypothetical protein